MKRLLNGNIRQYAMLIALLFVVVLFQILTDGILLKPINISNLIQQNAYVLILATGMLLCILTCGNIDLAIGSVVGLVGAITAIMIVNWGIPVWAAIFAGLIIGLIIGAWQGFWIAYVGIPAFITTLAGMLIFRGLTMVILNGKSIAPLPESYSFISAGFLPDFSGYDKINMLAVLLGVLASIIFIIGEVLDRNNKKRYNFEVSSPVALAFKIILVCGVINGLTYSLALYKGIPTVLVLVILLVIIYTFITQKTIAGRHIYAYGGNPKAAELSGVKTKKVLFWVYANMGLMSGIAGVIFTGRLGSATPKAGNGFELDAIAACFIGGASTTGGIGTVVGAIIGGLLMGVLNNGMSILGVSIDWQQAIKGFVLLFAVAFDVYSKSRAK